MAFYDLECSCGEISEHMMGMTDPLESKVSCPCCGAKLCRKHNIVYPVPQIQGDTVAGGVNYSNYYDDGLGEYVTSKSHRKDLMEKKGLVEYSPDPTMKKHRDEARYIREGSKPNDLDALTAIRKEYNTANSTRRGRLVKASMEKSFKKMSAD
jgi:hypothetical protein